MSSSNHGPALQLGSTAMEGLPMAKLFLRISSNGHSNRPYLAATASCEQTEKWRGGHRGLGSFFTDSPEKAVLKLNTIVGNHQTCFNLTCHDRSSWLLLVAVLKISGYQEHRIENWLTGCGDFKLFFWLFACGPKTQRPSIVCRGGSRNGMFFLIIITIITILSYHCHHFFCCPKELLQPLEKTWPNLANKWCASHNGTTLACLSFHSHLFVFFFFFQIGLSFFASHHILSTLFGHNPLSSLSFVVVVVD